MNGPEQIEKELDAWQQAGLTPRLFLRDDDAIEDTVALRRLCELTLRFRVPLLLAIIPDPARESLVPLLSSHPHVTPAVHGFRHQRHSPKGEKTSELGDHRPAATVLGELRQGREKLVRLFAGNVSGILVPPWNRISATIRDRVGEAGFEAISAHGWDTDGSAVAMVNAHVDIIHWSGGKVGREADWVFSQLATNLEMARQCGGAPVGVLLHHLDHDARAWSSLQELFIWSAAHEQIAWVAADSLIAEARKRISP
ncbi:MAG: polysaccharide deacetylase family protein [Rhizobiaceae bacterium]